MKRKDRSGLINLSSGSAICVFKGASNYGATKTFDDFFSRAIKEEIKHKVDVLTVRPYYVTSAMTRNTTSPTHSTTEQTGTEVVNSLGNTDICYGPFSHRFQGALMCDVEPWIVTKVVNSEFDKFLQSYHKDQ